MNDLNEFYNSILNINNKDYFEEIKRIVIEERTEVNTMVDQLDGFCKYFANQIEYRKKKEIPGVHTYKINLNDLVFVDHTILIVEYMTNSQMKRLLIDPSFTQFIKKNNAQLIKLSQWPGDKIDESLMTNLVKYGLVEIDNLSFQNFLNSFVETHVKFDLEDYLLENKIRKK